MLKRCHTPVLLLALALTAAFAPVCARALTEGNYTYTVTNGLATITDFNSSFSGSLTIPRLLGGCPVVSIFDVAFMDCSGVKNVTIPDSVTKLGDSVFYGCESLSSVTLPSSITSLQHSLFFNCYSLGRVEIPGGVTNIGNAAFADCSALKSVYFKSSAPSLGGPSVFSGCYQATVYRLAGAANWPVVPNTWGGRPTALWNLPYTLTVNRGTGGGSYTNGQSVTVSADAVAGLTFERWTGATEYVADPSSSTTVVTMPASNITITATFVAPTLHGAAGVPVVPIGNTNAVRAVSDHSGDGGLSVLLGGAGQLGTNEMAGIEWSVQGRGVLTFDWQVSSEAGYDWLRFYEVGAGVTNEISGTGGNWTRVRFDVRGEPDAIHIFRWEYSKDVSDTVGLDCGWVDAISWAPCYSLTVENGNGDGVYTNGTSVPIVADAPAEHMTFDRWTGDTNGVGDIGAWVTTYRMPTNDAVVTATYRPELYPVTVLLGSGSGSYPFGEVVEICASTWQGKRFYRWSGEADAVADASSSTTTVTVVGRPLTLTATYEVPLTVTAGSGSGWYPEGASVNVTAEADALYQEFAGWAGDAAGLMADRSTRTSSLTIPDRPLALTATYRESVARVAGCYGRHFAVSGAAGGVSADYASGSPSGTPSIRLGGPGVVPDNGFAAFETVVLGGGQVTFIWRVSSEMSADYLRFLVDGVPLASRSGTKGAWEQVTHRVDGAGATHTLRWEYAKNGSLASSSDAGWVDDVVWAGDVPAPAITPDIYAAASTNATFAIRFLGERGIPYSIYSNGAPRADGWVWVGVASQERGESNGIFHFEAVLAPAIGHGACFFRVGSP